MNEQLEQALATNMAGILSSLLGEKHFLPPLYMALICVDGGLLFARFTVGETDDLEFEFLAQHPELDVDLRLPANVMITDSRGEAARIVFESPSKYRFVH